MNALLVHVKSTILFIQEEDDSSGSAQCQLVDTGHVALPAFKHIGDFPQIALSCRVHSLHTDIEELYGLLVKK